MPATHNAATKYPNADLVADFTTRLYDNARFEVRDLIAEENPWLDDVVRWAGLTSAI
jgi:hypothetical protein